MGSKMGAVPRYLEIKLTIKGPQGKLFSGVVAFSKRATRQKNFQLDAESGSGPSFVFANTAVLSSDFKSDLYCMIFLSESDFSDVRFFLRYPAEGEDSTVATGRNFSDGQFKNWSARLTRDL
ncbi:MAG: hypothetical protein NT093_01625 [Candidatus Moranbacteria bacterium]|nr:hypothetical protein [Candidatus Moranbacteria bacterium]